MFVSSSPSSTNAVHSARRVRPIRGRRLRKLALMASAVLALSVPAAAHAAQSPPGGLGDSSDSPYGSAPDPGNPCPTKKWYRKPNIVIHLTEFERANSDALDELTMIAGIQDVTPVPHNGVRPKKRRRV